MYKSTQKWFHAWIEQCLEAQITMRLLEVRCSTQVCLRTEVYCSPLRGNSPPVWAPLFYRNVSCSGMYPFFLSYYRCNHTVPHLFEINTILLTLPQLTAHSIWISSRDVSQNDIVDDGNLFGCQLSPGWQGIRLLLCCWCPVAAEQW